MSQDREFELKFEIGEAEVERLLAHPALAPALGSSRVAPLRLNATYFDTSDRLLSRRKISLRVRSTDGRRKQTLKAAGVSILDRNEWESDTESDAPSPEWLAATPLSDLFRKRVIADLTPVFTVEVERQILNVVRDGVDIEAAFDRGTIRAASRTLPVHEFELELKQGAPADLFALARRLVTDLALMPSLVTKAERGFRLADGGIGRSTKAMTPELAADMPTAGAIQAIAEACLHDFLLNIGAFSPDGDIEIVHRGRVALRRLRAMTSLFKPVLADDDLAFRRADLKWMSGLLGDARDLDVFQSEVFDPAARTPDLLGAHELAEHMRAKQQKARAALQAAIVTPRWRIAVNELIIWFANGAWRQNEDAARPLAEVVVPRLRRRRKHLVMVASDLATMSSHERHLVRIEAKKLRYGLEFVASTSGIGRGSKRFRTLQSALETMQGALGQIHDHEAKQDLLRREAFTWDGAATGGGHAVFAAGMLAQSAPDLESLLEEAVEAARTVRRTNPF